MQGVQRKGRPVSLTRLTEHVLGKPLDKAARMSDWNTRPLSPVQQRYAALDAWVLVSMYDTLSSRDEQSLAALQARVGSYRVANYQRCVVLLAPCGRCVSWSPQRAYVDTVWMGVRRLAPKGKRDPAA